MKYCTYCGAELTDDPKFCPSCGANLQNIQNNTLTNQSTAFVQTDGKMPSKNAHLVLLIVGFCCGVLWGILSIAPYNNMNAAIKAGDVTTARANAKKVETFVIIGIVINVLFFIIGLLQ